ncbi:unnamed protein product [Rotaria socialis]|uniref:FCP1 homology domain-containing protein n=1 Tax=Rotaria socialis TaxID=392032 RepID=A0A821B6P7_9BILA|nr:unnamed protein product [Rotaria socialis]CAF4588385.1 unnamed protein product [Rotaria socialis]
MSPTMKVNPSNNATTTTATSSPADDEISQSLPSLTTSTELKNQCSNADLSNQNLSTVSPDLTTSEDIANRAKARDIVLGLQNKNIKLIAIDFDNTFLSKHTGGRHEGKADSLVRFIRPVFKYFIQELLESPDFSRTLHVCFVSFSPQEKLIKELLRLAFKTSKTDRIIIRCNTPKFVATMRANDPGKEYPGKEYHLLSVVTEIEKKRKTRIVRREILLLDDDPENISTAEQFGHKVLQIRDEISLDILKDFVYNKLRDC